MIEFIEEVDSIDIPALEDYRTLKRPLEHNERGIFIIEGDKVVDRFLQSPLKLLSILLTKVWLETFRQNLISREEPVKVFLAEKQQIAQIVGFKYHQGVMAVGMIPPSLTLDTLLKKNSKSKLFVAVDRLESAENTGALVRNCAACGIDGLIVGENSADPYLRRAVRNSMGTVFNVPVVKSTSLLETLSELRNTHGFQIVAAHPRKDSVSLYNMDFAKDTCIVFGNEGQGVSEEILSVCTCATSIPMEPGVDSFNVACANAIVLYEVNRQRYNL